MRVEPGAPGEFAGVRFFVVEGQVWTAVLSSNESILLQGLSFSQMQRRMSYRLAGGRRWSSNGRRVGLLTGLILYVCDRTLGPEAHLRAQVSFLIKEMRLHRFTDRAIRSAVLAAQEHVPKLNAQDLLMNEELYFRAAVTIREFAIRQAPWLAEGVPAAPRR